MKIKNKSDYTITMHTAKVTKEVLEIEPTHYISNNVNDENYDGAFALIYNQAFKKYFETVKIPEKYRYYNRLSVYASKDSCLDILIRSVFIEDGNVDEYLSNWDLQPSFKFEETFHTMSNNRFNIYDNDDFKVTKITLHYFREPTPISFDTSKVDVVWEWKDDVAEVIIDETIKILAGAMEHGSAASLAEKRVETNN